MPFCVHCGREYESQHRFCNHCGSPVPPQPDREKASATEISDEPLPIVVEAQTAASQQLLFEPEHPVTASGKPNALNLADHLPFQRISLLAGLGILSLSFLEFSVSDEVSRARLEPLLFVAFLLALVVGFFILKARSHLHVIQRAAKESPDIAQLLRRVTIWTVIASILTSVLAITLGTEFGRIGSETGAYVEDLARYKDLGAKISSARNSAPQGLQGLLSSYSEIEPYVLALKPVADRLVFENQQYAARHPAERATTNASADAIRHTQKRCGLLLQQIAVGKEIQNTTGSEERQAIARSKLIPVLKEEDALDGR